MYFGDFVVFVTCIRSDFIFSKHLMVLYKNYVGCMPACAMY